MAVNIMSFLYLLLATAAAARLVGRDDDATITEAPSPTIDTTAQYTFTNFSGQSNTPDNFNGWFIDSNSLSPVACRGSNSWITSDFYGTCCPPLSQCEPATACIDDIISYPGTTYGCSEYHEDATCFSLTVFETYPTGSPMLNFYCESTSYEPKSLYRTFTKPGATTTTTGATTSTTPATPATTSSVSKPTAKVDPLETAPPDSSSDSSESNAWIAGAIIGPVAGICLAIFGFWYFRRRGANNKKIGLSSQDGGPVNLQQEDAEGNRQEYYKPQLNHKGQVLLSEYDRTAITEPRELAGSRTTPNELAGSAAMMSELPAEDVPLQRRE